MGFDIFLSYSRTDQSVADAFFKAASKSGLTVWYDQLVPGGHDWREAIVRALSQSNALVILFSETSNSSTQLIKELAVADNLGKAVIPVLIENTEPKGAYLYEMASRNWIRLYPDPGRKMDDLVAVIAKQVQLPKTSAGLAPAMQPQLTLASGSSPAARASDEPYWLPVKAYDGLFLALLTLIAVLHASGAKLREGGMQLLGFSLILILLYMFVMAVRNARLNRGILSVKSFASYVIIGCLTLPFAVLPDRIAGAQDANATLVLGFVIIAVCAGVVANVLQVILRPIFQRLRFRKRIATI